MSGGCLLVFVLLSLFRGRHKARQGRIENGLLASNGWWGWIWFFIGFPGLIVLAVVVGEGEAPFFHWTYPVLLLILFPDRVNRALFIFLGLPRAAYYMTYLANFTWGMHPKAAALCNALLAAGRRPALDLRRLTETLPRRRPNFQNILVSTDLLAEALWSDLEGDVDRTRLLYESLLRFPYKARGRRDQALAARWLLLDAARTGSWERLEVLKPWTRVDRFGPFLRAVAAAFDHGRVSYPRLYVAWLWAPRPLFTRPLLDRAFVALRLARESESAATTKTTESAAEPEESFEESLHQALRRSRSGDGEGAAPLWGELLRSPGYAAWRTKRCAEEDVSPPALDDAVRKSVVRTLRELGASSATLEEAVDPDPVWDGDRMARLTRLEEGAEVLERRIEGDRIEGETSADPWAELETWCNLRRQFDDTVASGVPLGLAFRQVVGPLWNWAAWLFNDCSQRAFAHSIFSWLHDVAVAIGDDDTAAHMRDNMRHDV